MNNEKLKIDLCGRLPYGVKVQYEGIINGKERGEAYSEWKIRNKFRDFFDKEQLILPDEEIGLKVAPLKTITQYKKYWLAKAGIRQFKSFYNGNGFKPLLFPIQSLTKEIQLADYNNGEPFVPIVELAKTSFGKNQEWETVKSNEKGFYCQNKSYRFHFNHLTKSFYIVNYKEVSPDFVVNQSDLFDLLNRWKIDYRGLINEGFAIEVNSDNNPYL